MTVRRFLALACYVLAAVIAALTVFSSSALDVGPPGPLKGHTYLVDIVGALIALGVWGLGTRLWRRSRVDPSTFD